MMPHHVMRLLLVLLAAPLAAQSVPSFATVRGELAFDGDATLGDFTGRTSTITGRLVGADSLVRVRGWVEARAGTLVTGNGRRDRDMYKSLEVGKFPTIRFDLDALAPGRSSGDSLAVTLRGRFTIHGVTREHAVPGWAWISATRVRFKGQLPMNLHDYRIGGLSKMLGLLKMHPDIVTRIDVEFR